jgi:hypothetical protein
MGWNLGKNGPLVSGEAALGIEMESFYVYPVDPTMEFHLSYYGNDATNVRFLSANFNRVSNNTTVFSVCDSFSWLRRSDGDEIVGLNLVSPGLALYQGASIQAYSDSGSTPTWYAGVDRFTTPGYASIGNTGGTSTTTLSVSCLSTQGPYAFQVGNEINAGLFTIGANGGASFNSDAQFNSTLIIGSAQSIRLSLYGSFMADSAQLSWTPTTHAYDVADTSISRASANTIQIGNTSGTPDASGTLKLTNLNVQGSITGPYSVSLTAQPNTIAATNLVAAPVTTALYEITYYLNDTTAGTSGTVSLTITWNDGAAQTFTSSNVTYGTLGAYVSGTIVVKATSGAIQYATTVTSAVGSPAYSLDLRVKQLA